MMARCAVLGLALLLSAAVIGGAHASNEQSLLYVSRRSGLIRGINADGSAPQQIVEVGVAIDSIAFDDVERVVYALDITKGDVWRGALGSTDAYTLFARGLPAARSLYVDYDARMLYVCGADDVRRIALSDTSQGTGTAVLSQPAYSLVRDRDADRLFFVGTQAIYSCALDGSGVALLNVPAADMESARVVGYHDGYVYWTGRLMKTVRRARVDGSGVEDVVSGLVEPRDMVAGEIMGLPRVCWLDTIQRHLSCAYTGVVGAAVALLDEEIDVDAFSITAAPTVLLPTPVPIPSPLPIPTAPTPTVTPAPGAVLLYVADRVGEVMAINTDGSVSEHVLAGLSPHGVAIAATGNDLYVADRSAPAVLWRDLSSYVTVEESVMGVSDVAGPEGVALDEEGTWLYCTDDVRVVRWHTTTHEVQDVVVFGGEVSDVAVSGSLVVGNPGEDRIVTYDMVSGERTTLLTDIATVRGVDTDGDYVYFTRGVSVWRVPLGGGAAATEWATARGELRGLAVNVRASLVCAADADHSAVFCARWARSAATGTDSFEVAGLSDDAVLRGVALHHVPRYPNGYGAWGTGALPALDLSALESGARHVAPSWAALLAAACTAALAAMLAF